MNEPLRIVVMGVAGSGKTSVGHLLAQALQCHYVEGDSLHPARNVEKMASGQPLNDEDRWPWLIAVTQHLRLARHAQMSLVLACSALKREYRDLLRDGDRDLKLVFLHGDKALLAQRLGQRQGHYMPASLLDSQLDTLQAPQADEKPLCFDIALSPQAIADALLAALGDPGAEVAPAAPQELAKPAEGANSSIRRDPGPP